MPDPCEDHVHSQFRRCPNGLTTHDYLNSRPRQVPPRDVGEMVATRVLELPASEENTDPYACPLCGETTVMGPHRPDCPEVLNGTAHPDTIPASKETPK